MWHPVLFYWVATAACTLIASNPSESRELMDTIQNRNHAAICKHIGHTTHVILL